MRNRHAAVAATADRPWFVRVKLGRRCEMRPNSRAGWLLTAAYALAMIGLGLALIAIDDPAPVVWIGWIVLCLAITSAFLLTAWRTSAPVDACAPGRSTKAPDHQLQSVVVALLGAAAIVGAAFLGFDL